MTSPWSRPSLRGKATPKSRDSGLFTSRQSLNYSSFIGESPRSQQRITLTSQLLEETPQRRVETFGLPLPVRISEALANRDGHQHSSVRIDQSGWAWLVTGRKLFVWRFLPAAGGKGMFCKELMLPATELYHKANLICVMAGMPTSGGGVTVSGVTVMAVSPEGMVRFWPSLVHDSNAIDMSTDLIGSHCHSLTEFQPYGCILMTTTNELMLLSGSQKTVKCQTLKTSSGMLLDFGRRMTSFIFGSQPAIEQVASWQRVLASNISPDNSRELFVLSGNQLFKWKIAQAGPGIVQEKLIFQLGLENLFKESTLRALQVNVQATGLVMVWCLDMELFGSQILVLAAVALGGPQTTQLFYVLGAVKKDESQAPTVLGSINVLQYTLIYEESNEHELLDFKLLLPPQSSSAFIYDSNTVICIPVYKPDDLLNKIDWQSPGDGILGSGLYEDKPLFFSSKHGIITVTVTGEDIGDDTDMPRAEASEAKVVDLSLADTTVGKTEDQLNKFKTGFLQFCQGNVQQSQAICDRLFPSEESGLDTAVLTLSRELIDDFPVSDPRWAESIPAGGISTSTSLIILHQLEDKLKAHSFFVDFLKGVGLWDELGVVTTKEKSSLTCYLICEHAEKLSAAVALCKVNKTYQECVDESIGLAIKKRQLKSQFRGLTEQDLFFREVSRISDVFESLLDHEQDVFSRQKTANSHVQTILAVNTILQEMLQEAWHYRQTNSTAYQPTTNKPEFNIELIPWTATSGPSGVRSLLLKQIGVTAGRGVAETDDQQTLSLLLQQMVDLADVLLDGYVYQLQSLRACPGQEGRYDDVKQKYEQDRKAVIQPLGRLGQRTQAASLAEKYHDFGILIELCESSGDQDKLQRYMTQFAEQGFSDYLFKWYMDKGERHKLMTIPEPQHEDLARFLSSHHHLSWLHDIHTKSFYKAHETLKGLAINETSYLGKKKTLLSLSKLALLASEDNKDDEGGQLEDIINEHDIILHQETLPSAVLQRLEQFLNLLTEFMHAGLDVESMPPLPPDELIELHVGDQNPGANEYDFKKALDLLNLAAMSGRYDLDETALKLHIWCKAVLRDDWSSLPAKDPIMAARNTIFFKTVELAYSQGLNLADFMPSLEALLETEELRSGGLSENPQFRFLLKSGYEQIERATVESA